MRVDFAPSRVFRLSVALVVAGAVALFLCRELELSRFWAVPGGLFVAVQLQKRNLI